MIELNYSKLTKLNYSYNYDAIIETKECKQTQASQTQASDCNSYEKLG